MEERMRFYELTSKADENLLKTEFQNAHKIGKIGVGDQLLFFHRQLKTYYIPYPDVHRCFRRVREIPAKIGCCSGSYDGESLVIWTKEGEAAEIPLPDSRAARILMEELKNKMPVERLTSPR
jgi:hypothetical protein